MSSHNKNKGIYIVYFLFSIIIILIGVMIYSLTKPQLQNKQKYIDWESYDNIEKEWLDNMFDKVYIITIPKRRNHVNMITRTMKIDPIIFNAVNKNNLDKPALIEEGKLSAMCILNSGRIACHMSHISVIEDFLKDEKAKTCFIFEDDIELPSDVLEVKNLIEKCYESLPEDWDIINFGKCWDDCNSSVVINKYVSKSFPLCRHSYLINRSGAEKILKGTLPMRLFPGDHMYRQLAYDGVLNMYSSNKPVFLQNRMGMGSNLANNDSLRICGNGITVNISMIIYCRNPTDVLEKVKESIKNNTVIIDEVFVVMRDMNGVRSADEKELEELDVVKAVVTEESPMTKYEISLEVSNDVVLIIDSDLAIDSPTVMKSINSLFLEEEDFLHSEYTTPVCVLTTTNYLNKILQNISPSEKEKLSEIKYNAEDIYMSKKSRDIGGTTSLIYNKKISFLNPVEEDYEYKKFREEFMNSGASL